LEIDPSPPPSFFQGIVNLLMIAVNPVMKPTLKAHTKRSFSSLSLDGEKPRVAIDHLYEDSSGHPD
jgi:hypothetical protein